MMRTIESGHFRAYVDAYDLDSPVIEVTMATPLYASTSHQDESWTQELANELSALKKGIADYIIFAQRLKDEEKAYAL